MKERPVMLNLQVKSCLPIRILRRAKNYQLMVSHDSHDRLEMDEIKVVQAQANVVREGEGE
jgi:type VI protein secretion system component VasA